MAVAGNPGRPHNGVLNNGIFDPIQGFDCNVWVQGMCGNGAPRMIGRFTSAVLTIRNATEAYMELDQRVPRYLDGEIQIAFVLERGMIDTDIFAEAMGYTRISRANRVNRSPRISVTFSVDATGDFYSTNDEGLFTRPYSNQLRGIGGNSIIYNPTEGRPQFAFDAACDAPTLGTGPDEQRYRSVVGRIKLLNCKIDSINTAFSGGRGVVPVQLQGVAEGYEYYREGLNTAQFSIGVNRFQDLFGPQGV